MEGVRVGDVSIHAPRAGGDNEVVLGERVVYVSIHAPRAGGDLPLPHHGAMLSHVSIHAPRAGGDAADGAPRRRDRLVSIHAPRAGGDPGWPTGRSSWSTIHAPRAGGDSSPCRPAQARPCFNPRPPRGGRPERIQQSDQALAVSIHAPRAGGDLVAPLSTRSLIDVSIHAPRAGGDAALPPTGRELCVSIHAPRAGGDSKSASCRKRVHMFQSTPPARGATRSPFRLLLSRNSFNPRPPRGGRPELDRSTGGHTPVSIHAPRAGGDSPYRRRIRGDSEASRFNPRPPRGGRRSGIVPVTSCVFQSTPPARGATRCAGHREDHHYVSIHAPRAGGDDGSRHRWSVAVTVSIHAPRAGGDAKN